MNKKIWKNLELKTAIMLLIVVVLISVALYWVFFTQYYGLIIAKLQDDASVVHLYAESVIDEASFYNLNTIEDEETELYKTTLNQLNEIRRIANIMYLYTATIDANGQFIYIVDGLGAEDISDDIYFCHIGDPIEPEIIPFLEQCFNGETVKGDRILNTEWGIVHVSYFPFHDSDGNIIGAIGVEFDCETLYESTNRVRLMSFIVALAISTVFVILAFIIVRRIVRNAESALSSAEKEKAEAEDMMSSMLNASPLSCQYWNKNIEIIDCNEASLKLFGYKTKKDYLESWAVECNPEYQPDGHLSSERGAALVEKAFAEGKCIFEWMHQKPDGTPIPSEVTFIRIKSGDNYFVASYTKDLRKEKALEEMVGVSHYDELTGTFTKEYLDNKLPRLIRMLSRSDSELSLMMLSVDFFKAFSDTYGSNNAEVCLKAITGVLQGTVRRADDFIVHYREDTFVVVLPNTEKIGAQLIAEKLLADVRRLNIPNKCSGVPYVSVSIGVTSGKVYHRQRSTDYLNRADEMHYLSKQGGYNRFTYADL